MTDIERKALALVNEVARELGWGEIKEIFAAGYTRNEALFRAIERHEAFRQEVSDVVEQALSFGDVESLRRKGVLSRFIIPKPKPDRLVDVFCKCLWSEAGLSISTKEIRAALDAAGFEIREKKDV